MIRYTTGNLLDAKTQALVNTVNTVGVMGKEIALQFKEAYPENYRIYRQACKEGALKTGQVLAVADSDAMGQKWILNFPTKAHWKGQSQYAYIEEGLRALRKKIGELGLTSVALPPLGCGNGGLDWQKVKPMIEAQLAGLDAEIVVYEPNDAIKALLQKENSRREVKLTPARAMLLYCLFAFEDLGEQSSVFVANKLAYFLQRSGEKLRLKFTQHYYGPYSVQLDHVLYALNGSFLRGLEQNKIGPFEPIQLNYQKWNEVKAFVEKELAPEQRQRLESVLRLIDGFESAFSLELLATVDFLLAEKKNELPDEAIMQEIKDWSARKSKMFRPEYVEMARKHLDEYAVYGFA